MAWYSDEQYAMIQDCRDKKSTAASAFKQRTHCGKSGGVKFPSDFMTKKERESMNSECVSYRMGDPITWDEFKTWPEEHQKTYILNVREKFKVPNTALAKAMGVEEYTLGRYTKCLGISQGKEAGGAGKWWHETDDATRFWAWWNGEEISESSMTPDLKEPMAWSQFKNLTKEQKIEYISRIRDIFGAPDKHIAETLFRISAVTLRKELAGLDLNSGKESSGRGMRLWNKESFIAWCAKNKKTPVEGPVTKVETVITDIFEAAKDVNENVVSEPEVEAVDIREEVVENVVEDIPEVCDAEEGNPGPVAFTGNSIPVIPKAGSMTFENNSVDDILQTLRVLLSDVRVNMKVEWECRFE